MTATLRSCPGCSRHVRVSGPACPFCLGKQDNAFRSAPSPRLPAVGRLSRAALFALGAGGIATGSACATLAGQGHGGPACEGGDCIPYVAAEASVEAGSDGASLCAPLLGLPDAGASGPCGPGGTCIQAAFCEGPGPAGGVSCSDLWVCVFSPDSGCHASNGALVCHAEDSGDSGTTD
jgi:hypothetical protein